MCGYILSLLQDHSLVLLYLFIAQGIIGILLFEWAWKQSDRVRSETSEQALHDQFPSFRRPDTHLWKRSKFYPGCFLMLMPRFLWILFWFGVIGVLNYVCYFGIPMDQPCTGWRRWL